MMRLLFDSGENVQISCKLKFSFLGKNLLALKLNEC